MDKIQEVITILNQGGIVIFPTDTAFGIGCRVDKEDSVKRLFDIRKRPASQAVPVLVNSFSMAEKYWQTPLPDIVRHLAEKYWPGGLTIIYKCIEEEISPLVRGNGKTIGFRMPDHEIPLNFIEKIQVPLLGPSANFHGEKTPFYFKDLDSALIRQVDFILDGECKAKLASTVIDCTQTPFKILRQGTVVIKL